MANYQGALTSYAQSSGQNNRLVRAVDEDIAYLEPNEGPLVTILRAMEDSKRGVPQSKVEWLERDFAPRWGYANSTINSSATSLDVTDGTAFVAGMRVCAPRADSDSTAPEVFTVTSISTNTLTIVRGANATTITSGDPLRILGVSFEENAAFGTPVVSPTATKYNYTEIIRTPWSMSRTAMQSMVYGARAGDWNEEAKLKLKEHKITMNAKMIWGVRSESFTGGPTGNPIRTMNGIANMITTNVVDVGGTLSRKGLELALRKAFRYGSRVKLGVMAPVYIAAINAWANSQLRVEKADTSWGLAIDEVRTPWGILRLVNDWALETPTSGGNGFSGWGFILDPAFIGYRYLEGNGMNSDTKAMEIMPEQNLLTDGAKGEYLTEASVVLKKEQAHVRLFNATDYFD